MNLISGELRAAAAYTLGEIGAKPAVKALIRSLEDEDDAVRQAAAEALGEIGDKRAIGPLKRAVYLGKLDVDTSFGQFADLFQHRLKRAR